MYLGGWDTKEGGKEPNETEFTVPAGIKVAPLSILSCDQAKYLAPVDPNLYRYLERMFSGEAEVFLNQLYKAHSEFNNTSKFWFLTPEDKPD